MGWYLYMLKTYIIILKEYSIDVKGIGAIKTKPSIVNNAIRHSNNIDSKSLWRMAGFQTIKPPKMEYDAASQDWSQ